MSNCKICSGSTYEMVVKEQMLGFNEKFLYNICNSCGHCQINEVPENLAKYYSNEQYYSFKKESAFGEHVSLKNKLFARLNRILIALGLKKSFSYSPALKALLKAGLTKKNCNILDFGCGSGHFVNELLLLGFANTKGYDPFLPNAVRYQSNVVLTNEFADLANEKWDFVILNHVFEHLEKPFDILKQLSPALSLESKILIRIPVIDSFAFKKYQENWVQFDAPRHINIFSRKSFKLSMKRYPAFVIERMYDDSFHFQFSGSELYMKHLTLRPEHNNKFKRLTNFKNYYYHFLAKKLNKKNQGDQIVVELKKTAPI
jgi:SAM-dependent methyltransferase